LVFCVFWLCRTILDRLFGWLETLIVGCQGELVKCCKRSYQFELTVKIMLLCADELGSVCGQIGWDDWLHAVQLHYILFVAAAILVVGWLGLALAQKAGCRGCRWLADCPDAAL